MGENVEKLPFRGKPVENAPSHPSKGEFRMTKKQKKVLYQIIAAVILIVILKLLPAFPTPVELVLYLIPYLVVGWDVLRKALRCFRSSRAGSARRGCQHST